MSEHASFGPCAAMAVVDGSRVFSGPLRYGADIIKWLEQLPAGSEYWTWFLQKTPDHERAALASLNLPLYIWDTWWDEYESGKTQMPKDEETAVFANAVLE